MKESFIFRSGMVVLALGMVVVLTRGADQSSPAHLSGVQEPPSSFYHRGGKRNPFLSPLTPSHVESPTAQTAADEPSRGLQLIGILRNPGHPSKAVFNHRILIEGQSSQFELDGRAVKVKLLRVDEDAVIVELDGKQTLMIKLQESRTLAPAPTEKEKP